MVPRRTNVERFWGRHGLHVELNGAHSPPYTVGTSEPRIHPPIHVGSPPVARFSVAYPGRLGDTTIADAVYSRVTPCRDGVSTSRRGIDAVERSGFRSVSHGPSETHALAVGFRLRFSGPEPGSDRPHGRVVWLLINPGRFASPGAVRHITVLWGRLLTVVLGKWKAAALTLLQIGEGAPGRAAFPRAANVRVGARELASLEPTKTPTPPPPPVPAVAPQPLLRSQRCYRGPVDGGTADGGRGRPASCKSVDGRWASMPTGRRRRIGDRRLGASACKHPKVPSEGRLPLGGGEAGIGRSGRTWTVSSTCLDTTHTSNTPHGRPASPGQLTTVAQAKAALSVLSCPALPCPSLRCLPNECCTPRAAARLEPASASRSGRRVPTGSPTGGRGGAQPRAGKLTKPAAPARPFEEGLCARPIDRQ